MASPEEELISELESQLEEVNQQLEDANQNINDLQELVDSGGGGSTLELQEELRELRKTADQADNELQEALDNAKVQENKARELEVQVEALKLEKISLTAEAKKANEEMEEAQEALQAARQRSEQAAQSEGRLGAREKSHKSNLIKTLTENEDLRQEVADLQEDIQTLYAAFKDSETALKAQTDQANLQKQELTDTEMEVQELRRLLKSKEKEISEAQDELAAVGELESEVEERVKAEVDKWAKQFREAEAALSSEKAKQKELIETVARLKADTGVRELEEALVVEQEKYQKLEEQHSDLAEQLRQTHEELLEVANEHVALKEDQGKFVEVALEEERSQIEVLNRQLAAKDERIEEERERYAELVDEKAALDEELADRELWMAEYERGHGLTEAVVYQKKLKGDIKRRDKEIRRVNQELSERIAAHERLYEICRRLKKKAGLAEDFEFDDLELAEGMKGEVERYKAGCKELEKQNDFLEDERLRLLKALRLSAQNMGEKGMRWYGLNAEQIIQVNEFAENVRDGKVELPLDNRSHELRERVRELERELREARKDVAAAESALENGGVGHLSGTNRSSERGLSPRTALHGDLIKSQMEQMKEQQARMQSELATQMQKSISALHDVATASSASFVLLSGPAPSQNSNIASSPKRDPRIDDMMAMLQVKLGEGSTSISSEQVAAMQAELGRLEAHNAALQQQLHDERSTRYAQSASSGAAANISGLSGLPPRTPSMARQPIGEMGHGRVAQGVGGLSIGMPAVGAMAMSVPSTPSGQRMQKQQITSLRLPPEEWAEQFSALNAQLIECLEELAVREKEAVSLEDSVKKYQGAMRSLSDRQTLLYREHIAAKAAWTEDTDSLRREADDARAERDALRAKARRLDTMCAVLEGGEGDARDHVRELSRKVAVYEVNEVVMARRYNLLAEDERSVRTTKELVQHDMIALEATLRERVLYLEQWKAGAQSEIESMQLVLDKCVPSHTHENTAKELSMVKSRLRDVLGREAELRAESSGSRSLRRRVSEVEAELEAARAGLSGARREAQAARDEVAWMRARSEEAATLDEQASLRKFDELSAQVARLRGEAVEKEIMLATVSKKAEILERRATELTEMLASETNRAENSEVAQNAARKSAEDAQDALSKLRAMHQGGANREERAAMDDRIKDLEKMYGALSREAERSKEVADIATAQVTALEGIKKAEESEVAALREQLRIANSRTDDDAIIGKLQHQLTSTKVSYQLFARKYDMSRVLLRRKDLELRKLEVRLDDKDALIKSTREQARARILALETAIEQLSGEGVIVDPGHDGTRSGASGLTLQRMEQLSETIAKLSAESERAEESLRASELSRRNLLAEVEDHEAKMEGLKRAMEDTRSVMENADVDTRSVARRMLALNEELNNVRLDNLRQKREISALSEEKSHLERLREQDQDHLARLEDNVVETETTLRKREDEWNLREAVGEHDSADTLGIGRAGLLIGSPRKNRPDYVPTESSAGARLSDAVDGPQNMLRPGHAQTIEKLESTEKEVFEAKHTMTELHSQIREADRRYASLQDVLQSREARVRYLSAKLEAEGIEVDADDDSAELVTKHGVDVRGVGNFGLRKSDFSLGRSSNGGQQSGSSGRGGGGKYYEADARKMQVAAQQTVSSLKDMLDRKTKTIEELKAKLEAQRRMAMAERERDQAEIERLTERLYEENKNAIGKLRTAFADIASAADGSKGGGVGSGGGSGVDHAQLRQLMEQLEESETILERKDRRILELETMVTEARTIAEDAERRAGEGIEIQDQLREKIRRLAMQVESKTMDKLVKQLKAQLLAKEKKLAGLRAAVVALKTEFVKSEEEHERQRVARERSGVDKHDEDESALKDSADRLKRQVEMLKGRVERTRSELEKAKRSESEVRSENLKLRRQLQEAVDGAETHGTQLSRTVADTRRYQGQVDELRRENKRLKETLRNVKDETRGRVTLSNDDVATLDSAPPARTLRIGTSHGGNERIEALERKLKVLEAQNSALRSAAKKSHRSSTVLDVGEKSGGGRPLSGQATNRGRMERSDTTLSRRTSAGGGGSGSQRVAAWEADKRLKSRVQTLQHRLEEKTRELEAAQAQVKQAKALLDRANKERTVMQARLSRATNAKSDSTGLADALHKASDAERDIRARLFHAEEALQKQKRMLQVQLPNEIETLRRENDSLAHQLEEASAEAAELRRRARNASGGGRSGGIREEEERYVREDRLRENLESSRREARDLEAKLLKAENIALELRFEVDESGAESTRLRSRIHDLEAFGNDSSATAREASANIEPESRVRKPGERFKRERDLEGVVAGLKRVVSKLQGENERLKKSTASNVKYVELTKDARRLRAKVQELESERSDIQRVLKERLSANTEVSFKHARLKEQTNALRRQLRERDAEVNSQRQQITRLDNEKRRLIEELEQASNRVVESQRNALDVVASTQRTSERDTIGNDKARSRLVAEIADRDRQINRLENRLRKANIEGTSAHYSADPGELESLRSENAELKEANTKLLSELNAFDLDFFEEIEDLKFKYHETKKENERLKRESQR